VKQMRFNSCRQLALAFCLCSLPGMATVVFSDLGSSPTDVYESSNGWTVAGSGFLGTSTTSAELFTAAGVGSLSVDQIDLAVGNANAPATFVASIFTDNSGLPGTQVAGADLSLSTSTSLGTCCGLVTVTGITGVTLTAGDEYFMILGPVSTTDDSWNAWNYNVLSEDGLYVSSSNGGATWTSSGTDNPLAAFDVLADPPVPEPGSWLMVAVGAAALIMRARYSRRASR